QNDYLGWMDF
uniref:Caerulein-like peptide n=1 Tax=Phlyctimantis maculatus TaxID=2517390 RepID=Q7LZC5_PHLMA